MARPPGEPPDWEKRNQDKGKDAFNPPARGERDGPPPGERGIPEPAKPEMAKKYDMPGPGGDAVRRQEAERSAIDRAKRLEAQKKPEVEKESPKKAVESAREKGLEGKTDYQKDVIARAERLKFANEFNNKARYKGHEK